MNTLHKVTRTSDTFIWRHGSRREVFTRDAAGIAALVAALAKFGARRFLYITGRVALAKVATVATLAA